MREINKLDILISESDMKLFIKLDEIIQSEDFESKNLAKQLFKTSDLYRFEKPSKLYVKLYWNGGWSYNRNLKYLLSNSTQVNNYNLDFIFLKNLIRNLCYNHNNIKFYG